MSDSERYQVANSNLVYDTIEGEVILLDIETGTYYQLVQNSVPVWNWLTEGVGVQEVVARLAQQFPNDAKAIPDSITHFIEQLLDEKLLAPLPDGAPLPTPETPYLWTPDPAALYVVPTLLKYTDMQSLLLLDPIHDIDSQGWPILKPNSLTV